MKIKQSKTLENIVSKGLSLSRARKFGHPADSALLVALEQENCHASHILRNMLKDWEIYQIRVRLEREMSKQQPLAAAELSSMAADMNDSVESVCLSLCGDAAQAMVNTGHLLVYILGDKSLISSRILQLYNINIQIVREYASNMPADEDYYADVRTGGKADYLLEFHLGSPHDGDVHNEIDENDIYANTPNTNDEKLDKYGVNLTRAATAGKIDPVIGREREIERLIQILGRRKKNNPVLIGEAGVGKSAIVEGLALKIASREVPSQLCGKTLFSLDVTSLVAGTKYRGEFEERMKELLKELRDNKDIIVFIDEIHTIVGAGSTQGSLDTANILKPALARGELQCIGATTLNEYRENIEKDAALERRFQKIIVEPTTKDETWQILMNIKQQYERHHSVRYSDEAVRACVELTDRYITDRQFPDKAIDLLDETGSRVGIFENREPVEITELEKLLASCTEQKRKAVGELVYEQAATLRLREIALKSRLDECRAEWKRHKTLNPTLITEAHVQEVISSMTGIPIKGVTQSEMSKLKHMSEYLTSAVIGQSEAIEKITKSVQRSRAGLKDPGKPIGVFMFVGPTGVGKTLLAKELARWMFDRDDALVRIDMSEYSEKHNISRLIGSPPGYVGYNEGGQLTEIIRRQPYSVVLFDEIEKAHPDVFNVMLQIFDEGRLTDGLGRHVDFRNTVIIMTSNVGSREIASRGRSVGYQTSDVEQREAVNTAARYRSALESTFAPEFINRINDIVVFNTLTQDDVERIVEIEMADFNKRASRLGYKINVTAGAKHRLATLGYQPRYGVRSLKRVILENIEEPVAQLIIGEKLHSGDTVTVNLNGDKIGVQTRSTKNDIKRAV